MKKFKKIGILLLFSMTLLLSCMDTRAEGNSPSQISGDVAINETNFPDPNFRSYLLEQSYGTDAVLTASEITSVNTMFIGSLNISDLTGIGYFTALTDLACANNQLTSLDLSGNSSLTHLYCYYNKLTSLDLSNNSALVTVDCGSNKLTSLDLSSNSALLTLNCGSNKLTSLDLSSNSALTHLYCYNNQLTSLDLSNNSALLDLDCKGNQLTSLDLSSNSALSDLDCRGNKLTSLDLSNNSALTDLDCSNNQLTFLDLSSNSSLTHLYCYGNRMAYLNLSENTIVGNDNNSQLVTVSVTKDSLGYIIDLSSIIPKEYLDRVTNFVGGSYDPKTGIAHIPNLSAPCNYKFIANINSQSVLSVAIDLTAVKMDLSSISITKAPKKTSYVAGQMFDKTDMVVTALFNDGTSKAITDYSCSPAIALTTGDDTIIISYTTNGITKTAVQPITVTAVALTDIKVTKAPKKTSYVAGQKFNKKGMVVKAYYNNGSSKIVKNYHISPSGALKTKNKTVTISYKEKNITKTTKHKISVKTVALTDIKVTKAPKKTSYVAGQKFNKKGMVVKAYYNNGSSKIVKNYRISPSGALKTKNKTVTISYKEKNITKTTKHKITVKAK